ncbi:Tetratricopeptide TPR_2 repeat-containing protein [Sphingobium chlorophenolicum L-1]|uniref:Tetratricopeptide TPR_2 repeat-containing protein n=1 Tax=Sphingobium chlorophenolicum L-1 TaxID=690566 RepID=F6EW19_SPHCR|nr:Tetratricopeptide TPR_2 repeat-containing protein [Sphingobium chlorophenolicum L-1]
MIWALLLSAAVPQAAAVPALRPSPPLDYARLVDEAIDGGRIIQAEAMLTQWRAQPQPQDLQPIEIATARMALEKRRDEEAAARFAALGQSGVKNCRVDEGQGIALLRLGRSREALEPLRRAVAACADRWRAWNALGVAYDQAQSWALSAAAYERAFQLTDKPAQILNNYGLSLLGQGKADKAAAIFDKAREQAPDDARIVANGDAAYVMSGQDIRRRPADTADEWGRRLSNAGQVAMRMGDLPRAQAYLSRAVTEADGFVPDAAAALAAMGGPGK